MWGRRAIWQRKFGSRPNLQAQSAFLGASWVYGPDCKPQRTFRGQPPQAALRPRSRLPPRRPCGLSCGLGVSDPSPQAPPRQAGRFDPFPFAARHGPLQKRTPSGSCGLGGSFGSIWFFDCASFNRLKTVKRPFSSLRCQASQKAAFHGPDSDYIVSGQQHLSADFADICLPFQ